MRKPDDPDGPAVFDIPAQRADAVRGIVEWAPTDRSIRSSISILALKQRETMRGSVVSTLMDY